MINVGDIFISKKSNTKIRVLSYTGEGFDQNCYCLLETDDNCWNGYHSALHIEKYYTKLESYNEQHRQAYSSFKRVSRES